VTNSQDTEALFKTQREKINSLNDQIIALLAERQQGLSGSRADKSEAQHRRYAA
jgi:hypothetical protein